MSKWIDADAFLKEYCEPYPHVYKAMSRAMAEAPSIDIVFCKECRHRNERCGMGEHRWCEMLNMSTTPDDFCSYGEVRDE